MQTHSQTTTILTELHDYFVNLQISDLKSFNNRIQGFESIISLIRLGDIETLKVFIKKTETSYRSTFRSTNYANLLAKLLVEVVQYSTSRLLNELNTLIKLTENDKVSTDLPTGLPISKIFYHLLNELNAYCKAENNILNTYAIKGKNTPKINSKNDAGKDNVKASTSNTQLLDEDSEKNPGSLKKTVAYAKDVLKCGHSKARDAFFSSGLIINPHLTEDKISIAEKLKCNLLEIYTDAPMQPLLVQDCVKAMGMYLIFAIEENKNSVKNVYLGSIGYLDILLNKYLRYLKTHFPDDISEVYKIIENENKFLEMNAQDDEDLKINPQISTNSVDVGEEDKYSIRRMNSL